ncbi:sigma factor-like helix-turn-helix DNA-binding protein [Cohnella silvisoli]|uniref:Sigma factor-like helix-turn-helix DNA-binding protein n=1 Tax=Cohnella silvisoli TaxID=2873699 RepID=A0ABV1L3U4_9BACL|nr:sigma factor-like helix-turn-helix DNA-binding protein [Cohnella silvisoli]MCD9026032.1 hypothetical protein [Cohnella silvisoli]
MQDLIESYKRTRRGLRALRTLSTITADRETIQEMIHNCSWTIDYMKDGHFKKPRRPIERRSMWQRIILMEPKILNGLFRENMYDSVEQGPSNEQTALLNEIMSLLSRRERECFIAVYGEGFSFAGAADTIGVAKTTVSTCISRAKKKIAEWKRGMRDGEEQQIDL